MSVLTNSLTSEQDQLPNCYGIPGNRAVTSDGRVIMLEFGQQQSKIVLWTKGKTETLATVDNPGSRGPIIDSAGKWVIYEADQGNSGFLHSLDVTSGRDIVLAQVVLGNFQYSLSDEGSVVYVSYTQPFSAQSAFLIGADGSGRRQLTDDSEGTYQVTISDDGSRIYAFSNAWRLIQIDVEHAIIRELAPRLPRVDAIFLDGVGGIQGPVPSGTPGQVLTFHGSGFVDADLKPLIDVEINGQPVPVLQISATELQFQIPFEAPPGTAQIEYRTNTIFEYPPKLMGIRDQALHFVRVGTYDDLVVVHSTFDSLVTSDHPALQGELVHLYMVGLGAVSPPALSGQPAPLDGISTVNSPITCFLGNRKLNPLFAGLAPGFIGLYQVDVQIPQDLYGPRLPFLCSTRNGSSDEDYIPVLSSTP